MCRDSIYPTGASQTRYSSSVSFVSAGRNSSIGVKSCYCPTMRRMRRSCRRCTRCALPDFLWFCPIAGVVAAHWGNGIPVVRVSLSTELNLSTRDLAPWLSSTADRGSGRRLPRYEVVRATRAALSETPRAHRRSPARKSAQCPGC